jgi:hypothetical protein
MAELAAATGYNINSSEAASSRKKLAQYDDIFRDTRI